MSTVIPKIRFTRCLLTSVGRSPDLDRGGVPREPAGSDTFACYVRERNGRSHHGRDDQLHSGNHGLPAPTWANMPKTGAHTMTTKTKSTEAPATEAPATEAPATEAPATEAPRDALTREASEHAAFLQRVRQYVLENAPNHGICAAGMMAFLGDTGIPHNTESRRESRQPAIEPDMGGVQLDWLNDSGVVGLLAANREAQAKQRDKIARGIVRGASLGYYQAETVARVLSDLGLSEPEKQVDGSIYLGNIYFSGLPGDVTTEQVREAFGRVLSAAIGTYLPGWQHPEVTGVEVSTHQVYVNSSGADSDRWSF